MSSYGSLIVWPHSILMLSCVMLSISANSAKSVRCSTFKTRKLRFWCYSHDSNGKIHKTRLGFFFTSYSWYTWYKAKCAILLLQQKMKRNFISIVGFSNRLLWVRSLIFFSFFIKRKTKYYVHAACAIPALFCSCEMQFYLLDASFAKTINTENYHRISSHMRIDFIDAMLHQHHKCISSFPMSERMRWHAWIGGYG